MFGVLTIQSSTLPPFLLTLKIHRLCVVDECRRLQVAGEIHCLGYFSPPVKAWRNRVESQDMGCHHSSPLLCSALIVAVLAYRLVVIALLLPRWPGMEKVRSMKCQSLSKVPFLSRNVCNTLGRFPLVPVSQRWVPPSQASHRPRTMRWPCWIWSVCPLAWDRGWPPSGILSGFISRNEGIYVADAVSLKLSWRHRYSGNRK